MGQRLLFVNGCYGLFTSVVKHHAVTKACANSRAALCPPVLATVYAQPLRVLTWRLALNVAKTPFDDGVFAGFTIDGDLGTTARTIWRCEKNALLDIGLSG